MNETLLLRDEQAMRDFGARLVGCCDTGGIICLSGNLGTGKTTLVRGALQAMGISGGVRSPTYTLVEYYTFDKIAIAHFDLYRLGHPEELEYLGFRDYLNAQTLCFIEWPEHAEGYLQNIDLLVRLDYDPAGRSLQLEALSDWGRALVTAMARSPVSDRSIPPV